MRIKFLIVLLVAQVAYANAQEAIQVMHLNGTEQVGNNRVTVTRNGDSPDNTHYYGVSPYLVGSKDRINGYDFEFSEPVKQIQIRLAAVNKGELIEFGINGRKYNLFDNHIAAFDIEGRKYSLPAIEDGIITYGRKHDMANAIITIAPGYDISSFYVHHLNGKAAGAVFELFIVNGSTFGNGNSNGNNGNNGRDVATAIGGSSIASGAQLLQIFPNPNSGDFILKGNGYAGEKLALQIVNVSGQVVYEQQVTPFHQSINEKISLAQSLPGGLYTLYIIDGEQKDVVRFTLSR
ncbi:MAG: T9SS type A sorting domain-containing protein [Flavipsychrobacter sp.]